MEINFDWIQFLVSIGLAVFLFWLASRQLVIETRKLRHLNKLILLALQNSNLADLSFDKNGEIIGLNVSVFLPGAQIEATEHPPTVSVTDNESG